MVKNKKEEYEPLIFHAINEKNLTFEEVYIRITKFMQNDPLGIYSLAIGTDSQLHGNSTIFATCIMIHKLGKPAWTCTKKVRVPRKFENLHDKISTETSYTEEVAFLLTDEHRKKLEDIVLPYSYKGASLDFEGHIDVGSEPRSKTRVFIKEMENRIKGVGLTPKIKPDSVAASGLANWHTK